MSTRYGAREQEIFEEMARILPKIALNMVNIN